MPKLGMQSIRRRQLIDATLEAINEVGMHDATIAQIARRAGVSTGIISHYFRDKNGLLARRSPAVQAFLRGSSATISGTKMVCWKQPCAISPVSCVTRF